MPRRRLAQLGVNVGPPPPREDAGNHAYPRPMLRRAHWISLNGPWDFALDVDAVWRSPRQVTFERKIEVP
jgi:hypothetical protein